MADIDVYSSEYIALVEQRTYVDIILANDRMNRTVAAQESDKTVYERFDLSMRDVNNCLNED